jgi:predicted AAA+ superfamily ATPase
MDISALLRDSNPWWEDSKYRDFLPFQQRRAAFQQLREYLGDVHDDRALALLGPRQVGKTTLLRQLIEQLLTQGWPTGNITFFDFSDERLVEPISPRTIVDIRSPSLSLEHPRIFLFDEIQNARDWQKWLKQAVDQARRQDRPRPRFIVTGSAASSLRRGSVESGQGRWDEISVEGLTYVEYLRLASPMGAGNELRAAREPQTFERYLSLGGFPEHVRTEFPREARHRIRNDIAERAILRDLSQTGVEVERLRRLFVYLVTGSGNAWNQQKRADDLQANRKSVADWLALLEETRLVIRLEREREHDRKASAQLRAQSKIFAADHGLITAFSAYSEPMEESDVRARVFEAVVYRHLRELSRAQAGQLSFVRLREDLEIDFVFQVGKTKVSIEVTSSTEATSRKIVRSAEAMSRLGITRKLLIHGGLISGRVDDIETIPLHDFLMDPERYAGDAT